jgi:hypothetical protein
MCVRGVPVSSLTEVLSRRSSVLSIQSNATTIQYRLVNASRANHQRQFTPLPFNVSLSAVVDSLKSNLYRAECRIHATLPSRLPPSTITSFHGSRYYLELLINIA